MLNKKISDSINTRNLVDVVPLTNVDEMFTYVINELTIDDFTGYRVLIPFGKRKITGIVIKKHTEPLSFPIEKLKPILKVLDSKPILTKEMIELCKWISKYYVAPFGEVLKAVIPPKLSTSTEIYIHLKKKENLNIALFNNKEAKVINFLIQKKSPQSLKSIRNKLKFKNLIKILDELEAKGIITKINRMSGNLQLKKIVILNRDMFTNDKIGEFSSIFRRKKKIMQLIYFFYEKVQSRIEKISLKEIRNEIAIQNLNKLLRELEDTGWIDIVYSEEQSEEDFVKTNAEFKFQNELNLELNNEQLECLKKINESIEKGKFDSYLLFGVTGSGKTLVYIHSIKKCLELGKTAIVLVPEISLTSQLIERFNLAFPNSVAVLHSRLTQHQRTMEWISILNGTKKIVVGPRSAMFAPTLNTGLIIVDEEHEPTYKQEEPQPRYNARDVALVRGKIENAVVILGTATPSITTFYSAVQGKHKLLKINQRADGAELPTITLVDILEKRRQRKMFGQFSDTLINKIIDRLVKKEGIILFQNRRGFGLILECRSCGFIPKCPECEISLTYHKVEQRLKCHYCGYQRNYESTCPRCGKPTMLILGYGTQRIEEELSSLLNELEFNPKIARFDLDVLLSKKESTNILRDFYKGEIDILVGTQLIAKGLDFERVTLVGIINADLQLNLPDFSASERSFQLFTQVAGRAGRRSHFPGEVIIQTSSVDAYPIKAFLDNNYEQFYKIEINFRKDLNYPPFARLISIEIRANKTNIEPKVIEFVQKYLENLKFAIILGPITPIIPKIRGWNRKVILLKVEKNKDVSLLKTTKVLKVLSTEFYKKFNPQKIKLIIDVDSQFSLF